MPPLRCSKAKPDPPPPVPDAPDESDPQGASKRRLQTVYTTSFGGITTSKYSVDYLPYPERGPWEWVGSDSA